MHVYTFRKIIFGAMLFSLLVTTITPVVYADTHPGLAGARASLNSGDADAAAATASKALTNECNTNPSSSECTRLLNQACANADDSGDCQGRVLNAVKQQGGAENADWFGIKAAIREAIIFLAWIPVAISILFLGATGTIFDLVINFTIINFAEFYASNLSVGINAAWGGFRDISNIIMISMFVFIAFAVILGSETYGLKKFGTRILVVALLINFSLFFTKAIIDVSNITAIQFRKEMNVGTIAPNATDRTDGSLSLETGGIAGAFMHRVGITGIFDQDARDDLDKLLEARYKNGTLGTYVITTSIFLVGTASVLLYGAILLFTRVIVLILLMLTSSLAFAAYIIPKYGQTWWDKWWDTLIKNALFAPVFMLMLWAVLKITSGLSNGGSGLSGFANGNIGASFFNLVVVLGLLYGATKVADDLSTMGAGLAKSIAKQPMSLGSRLAGAGVFGLAGRFGRSTFGKWGANKANDRGLLSRSEDPNISGTRRQMARMQLGLGKFLGKSNFDFRDSKIAKNIQKTSGVALGAGIGNRDDYEKRREKSVLASADAAADLAKAAAEVRGSQAQSSSGGGLGGADDIGKAIKQGIEKSNKTPPVATQENQQGTSSKDDTADKKAENARREQETTAKLKDADIENTAKNTANIAENMVKNADKNVKDRKAMENAMRRTINKGSDDVPSAEESGSNQRTKLLKERLGGTLSREERGKTVDAIGKEAYRARVENYRNNSGFFKDSSGMRNRIADSVNKNAKKSGVDKMLEALGTKVDDLKSSSGDSQNN